MAGHEMFKPTLKNWGGYAVVSAVLAGLFGLGDPDDFVSVFVVGFVLLIAFPTFVCFGPAAARAWVNDMFR